MKIAIIRVGQIEQNALDFIQENIAKVFPNTQSVVLKDIIALPREAYDYKRKQYYSSLLLLIIREYLKNTDADKILGITTADLYVPQLNFVFGEAETKGKAAIISLHRLKPEFYGGSTKQALFLERALKEAIHEIGHAFGLAHCPESTCVMSFSNTIAAVDTKKTKFCQKCSERLSAWIQ
jgi:archaemetzincin